MKTALVCGITGQDGSYLAKLLLSKGYVVIGTTRDAYSANLANLKVNGLLGSVELVSMSIDDYRCVLHVVNRFCPDEIYNLAGQTSVGLSFEQPVEAMESIAISTLNLLEAIRFVNPKTKFFNAGSSECFGNTEKNAATENDAFRPRSPYAVAKSCAINLVASYREAYELFACSGVLFNHESPLRSERFVTQKIVRAARDISLGRRDSIVLGNLDIYRDWGWAEEYVEAIWLMLQQDDPEDVIIATGRSESLEYFVSKAFEYFNLSWSEYVRSSPEFMRPTDIYYSRANPCKAKEVLGWEASTDVDGVVEKMCEAVCAEAES